MDVVEDSKTAVQIFSRKSERGAACDRALRRQSESCRRILPHAQMKEFIDNLSAYTINGTGITFYGKKDPDPSNGSYIATKWITFFWLPILPLATYRISNFRVRYNYIVLWGADFNAIRLALSWKQIFITYIKALVILLVIFASLFYFLEYSRISTLNKYCTKFGDDYLCPPDFLDQLKND